MKKAIEALLKFRDERDWKQFHNSKDLALAISIEAAELNELFLWKQGDQINQIKEEKLKDELADVFSFALLLAEKHGLDPEQLVLNKVKKNAQKYPVEKAHGTSKKYTEL